MPLWGKAAAGTQAQKPKWLSTDEKSHKINKIVLVCQEVGYREQDTAIWKRIILVLNKKFSSNEREFWYYISSTIHYICKIW